MFYFVVIACLYLFLGVTYGAEQNIVLYNEYSSHGENVTIDGYYVADLTKLHFRVKSVCSTGIWIFYQEVNFNPNGNNGVEYVWSPNNFCRNLKTLGGLVSSIKYAGDPRNYSTDSLTIYQHNYFQGKEEYTFNQIGKLDIVNGTHQSVIITGNSSWTIFDQVMFQGNGTCLQVSKSENTAPVFLEDLQRNEAAYIPYGSIKSVRKGCVSKTVMDLTSMVTN